jgi:hypothetical protein
MAKIGRGPPFYVSHMLHEFGDRLPCECFVFGGFASLRVQTFGHATQYHHACLQVRQWLNHQYEIID